MRANYPSDITREQFEVIRHTIESSKKKTRPSEYDIYDVFCAVLYRKREGCRWRSLPHDFPKWQNCYYHYNEWRKADEGQESILDRALRELVESERVINGRGQKTTMTSGVKLHIGVDVLGLPNALLVTIADAIDRDGAVSMIGYASSNLSKCVKVLVDSGYT